MYTIRHNETDYMPGEKGCRAPTAPPICAKCHKAIPVKPGLFPGYSIWRDPDGNPAYVCEKCCSGVEARAAHETGRATLYLTEKSDAFSYKASDFPTPQPTFSRRIGFVSNFPGLIKRRCIIKKGSHNIAGTRYDVWFRWMGAEWHGVQYGENTQICHCRRLKSSRPN